MSNLEWLWRRKAIQSEREGKSFKKYILKYIESERNEEKKFLLCIKERK